MSDSQEPKMSDSEEPKLSDSEEPKYVVEKILFKKTVKLGKRTGTDYLIKWQGYSEEESTWVPKENLLCPDLVKEFEKRYVKKMKNGRQSTSSGTQVAGEKKKLGSEKTGEPIQALKANPRKPGRKRGLSED